MVNVRADALEVGQSTSGGQEILAISRSGVQYVVTWQPTSSKRKTTINYFPDQEFDMAPHGAPTQEDTGMAQKVNIVVESDLSGAADASTVAFGLDGTNYEIDLTDKEAEKFRDVMSKYLAVARKVGKGPRRSAQQQSGPSAKVIREWAQENGHDVPERGRIPAEVREAYNAAH